MRPRALLRGVLVLAAIPVVLFLAALFVGLSIPRDHVAANEAVYGEDLEEVWTVISDLSDHPAWRDGVNEMRRHPDRNGNPVWEEVGPRGSITYEVVEWDPPHRLTTRIADPDLPFGGTWSWTLEPTAEGVRVTLVERGVIKHPVFRFVARHLIGYHSSIDAFQRELARELRVTSRIIRVPDIETGS